MRVVQNMYRALRSHTHKNKQLQYCMDLYFDININSIAWNFAKAKDSFRCGISTDDIP